MRSLRSGTCITHSGLHATASDTPWQRYRSRAPYIRPMGVVARAGGGVPGVVERLPRGAGYPSGASLPYQARVPTTGYSEARRSRPYS